MRRWLLYPLALLVALIVVFEEWLWPACAAALEYVGRLPLLRALRARIVTLPPWGAALLFVVPAAALLPIKLLGLWLIHAGHGVLGGAVFVGGKVIGTALAARIYQLTEPALRQFRWLALTIDGVLRLKARMKAWALALPGVQVTLERLRAAVRAAVRVRRPALARAYARLRARRRLATRPD
jgi:hypothetical protein